MLMYNCAGNQAKGGPLANFAAAREIPSELTVERCSLIVSDWMMNCRQNHEVCNASSSAIKELPCRLLNLVEREGASVMLVETRPFTAGQIHEYASLSHCWGKTHVIQTTKENLSERMKGIEWDDLPRTFQDAIIITRSLGIRYIWIDSLCIVQDDIHDWNKESVRMAAIYSNSSINIAATGASDSLGGCLSPRSLKHSVPRCEIKSFPIETHKDFSKPSIFVRPSLESVHHRYSTNSSYITDLPDSLTAPLLSRAWVFQERYLAPRTLHFHPSEMVMECKSGIRCECSGLDKVVAISRRSSLDLKFDRTKIFNSWFTVVEEYSRLRITRESDRLPALTGVATVFQRKLECRYLAGLWENDIARGLLWDVTRYECTRSQRNVRRQRYAPTWSWASLVMETEGPGIIFSAGHDETFEVNERFVLLDTDIPFLATDVSLSATTGSICIRGTCIAAILDAHSELRSPLKDVSVICDQDLEDFVLITIADMNVDCTWDSLASCPLEPGGIVHCVLVGRKVDNDWESGQKTPYSCTVVLKQSVSNAQTFERIGVLAIEENSATFHDASETLFKII